jgi:hypothetical protein
MEQQANKVNMKVYTHEGSHTGREKYPAEWTLLGEGQVTPRGLDKMTEISLGSFTPVDLMAGTRHAFYITADRSVVQYTDGTLIHNLVIQNEHLMLLEGTALGRSFFGGLFEPRKFNGGLIYQELEEVPVPESVVCTMLGGSESRTYGNPTESNTHILVASDMLGVNGSFGSMVDVVAKRNDAILITGLNIHTKNRGKDVTVRVYTKQGSQAGYEQDRGDSTNSVWTLVLPPTKVSGAGMNLQTPLPDFAEGGQSSIRVEAGTTQAFLVILDTDELRYDVGLDFSKNANANTMAVDSQYEYLQVLQGTGLGREGAYYSPRLFNGAVRYAVAP